MIVHAARLRKLGEIARDFVANRRIGHRDRDRTGTGILARDRLHRQMKHHALAGGARVARDRTSEAHVRQHRERYGKRESDERAFRVGPLAAIVDDDRESRTAAGAFLRGRRRRRRLGNRRRGFRNGRRGRDRRSSDGCGRFLGRSRGCGGEGGFGFGRRGRRRPEHRTSGGAVGGTGADATGGRSGDQSHSAKATAQHPSPTRKSNMKMGDRFRRRDFRRVGTLLGPFATRCEE